LHQFEERVMTDPSIFISSCSRRDIVRRRVSRSALPLQALLALLVLLVAFGAFVAGRGGI
jgi:hypothetical protein